MKPVYLNQGKGIEMFSKLNDIKNFLAKKQFNSQFIVQKYIEKPLLYYGRKFDIRVWALVAPNGDLHVYNKSYIRTSSFEYSLEDQDNLYIHLTNNCLQQKGQEYSKYEKGNTLPLESLFSYIREYLKSSKKYFKRQRLVETGGDDRTD